MSETPTSSVLGLPIHLMNDYPGFLRSRLQQGIGTHVVTLNAEMTMQAECDATLAKIDQAELVIPDGAGVVLYLRLQGKHIQRYPGIECRITVVFKPTGRIFSVFSWVAHRGCSVSSCKMATTKYQD